MSSPESDLNPSVQRSSTEPAASKAPPATPPAALNEAQQAYLLHFLAQANEGSMRHGEIRKKVELISASRIGLNPAVAMPGLERMVADGLIETFSKRGTTNYRLTERGRARLQALEAHRPSISKTGGDYNPPANENIKREREACLLLGLLEAEGNTLTGGEANRLVARTPNLDLNPTTATKVREELAERGLIAIERQGRTVKYALTSAGRMALGNMKFSDESQLTIKGRVLNDLMEAARDAAKEFEPSAGSGASAPSSRPSGSTSPEQIERAIMEAFDELRREKYAMSGMVPIHEIRQRIRQRVGADAARHEVLDDVVQNLWRTGRLRLIPLTDHGNATPEQMQDSIPGMGETLFFVEMAHEPAVV
jgi:DNA-binding PadR family transcriptional regulator